MAKYYSGNIEGKFWLASQSSNAADRFGATGFQQSYLEYYFDEDHLEDVENEIKLIEEKLGDKLERLITFFTVNVSYTCDQLRDMDVSGEDLSEYADYTLGVEIRDCIKEHGSCSFTAEC
jgi:hypothetical protein